MYSTQKALNIVLPTIQRHAHRCVPHAAKFILCTHISSYTLNFVLWHNFRFTDVKWWSMCTEICPRLVNSSKKTKK